MMKKVIFMLAMLTCILASCSDGGSDNPVDPTPKPEEVKAEITIDSNIVSNGLSFGVASGEQTVSFSANTNWTLSVASTTSGATWCKASVATGSKGTANVKFTVDENTDYDDRSVSVTIKAGSASKTFTITQKGADALLITTNKYEVAQEGGKIEVEVKANINYELAISETAKDWITESKSKSRTLTTYKHTFEIAANEESEKREGEITFKSDDKVETVMVYQAGGAILLLSQNEFTVSDAGDTISVDVKSNVEYGVQMPDVDWINDNASSRGMSSHTLKYVINANEGYDTRSAEIIFYDKNSDLKDTLKVVQVQKDTIIISEKRISVDKEGGIVEVKINTNIDFEVQIPSDVTWVNLLDSRALTERNIYLQIEENTGEDSRKVEIVISNEKRNIRERIEIEQNGDAKVELQGDLLVVTLSKAGTLKQLLGDYFSIIFSLKIIGPINGDDIYGLRKMLGGRNFSESGWGRLTTLDLSEAEIVEGGDWYYNSYRQMYTSNDVVGDQMFINCCKLENIVLPKNLKSVGEQAFSGCDALKSIVIPDGVSSIGRAAFDGCSSLRSIIMSDVISMIESRTFYGCSSLNTITLPQKLISIGDEAFVGCDSLTTITLPDNVESIGDLAFCDCALTSMNISNNVKSIGYAAFYGNELSSVIIPNSVTFIGSNAFFNNPLKRIDILDLSAWCNINFGKEWTGNYRWELYLDNKSIKELIIPMEIKEIKKYAFLECNLLQVDIHDNVVSIGDRAFYYCNLKKAIIGKGCKMIGHESFAHNYISECYCYATIPPKLNENSFSSQFFLEEKENMALYVPTRCRSMYMLTEWNWCFDDIVEID